jgi:hypothetical protein
MLLFGMPHGSQRRLGLYITQITLICLFLGLFWSSLQSNLLVEFPIFLKFSSITLLSGIWAMKKDVRACIWVSASVCTETFPPSASYLAMSL